MSFFSAVLVTDVVAAAAAAAVAVVSVSVGGAVTSSKLSSVAVVLPLFAPLFAVSKLSSPSF